jgi:Domain of unknown function (DUF4340)
MKQKRLTWLLIVTVVVAGAAIYTVKERDDRTVTNVVAEQLFPDLSSKINSIDEIAVQSHDRSVTVKRNPDGHWVVATKYDYPASFETVKKTIVGFVGMTVVEPKTADPKLFPELGLADVASDGSKAKLVALASDGKTVASILFGERKYVPGVADARAYVRKADGGRAWLVDHAPDADNDVKHWMVSETVSISRERMKDAVLNGPNRRALTVYRDSKDEKDFKVRNMPSGAKLDYAGAPDAIAGALAAVNFDDVKPLSDVDFAQPDTAVFTTFDGLEVTVSLVKQGDETWAKFEAAALPGASAPAPEKSEAEIADATDKADNAAPDSANQSAGDQTSGNSGKDADKTPDVAAEAKAINDRVGAWAYKLPDYKAKDFTKRMDDILAKDNKETKKAAPSAGSHL